MICSKNSKCLHGLCVLTKHLGIACLDLTLQQFIRTALRSDDLQLSDKRDNNL